MYTCTEYYPAIKNNEIMPIAATWMDLEMIILKSEKDKYPMTSCVWNLKRGYK